MPSVSKTQYGTYRVLWYSGRSKKQKTFRTKTEAKKFAAALELSPEEKSGSSCIVVGKKIKQLHWKAVV